MNMFDGVAEVVHIAEETVRLDHGETHSRDVEVPYGQKAIEFATTWGAGSTDCYEL